MTPVLRSDPLVWGCLGPAFLPPDRGSRLKHAPGESLCSPPGAAVPLGSTCCWDAEGMEELGLSWEQVEAGTWAVTWEVGPSQPENPALTTAFQAWRRGSVRASEPRQTDAVAWSRMVPAHSQAGIQPCAQEPAPCTVTVEQARNHLEPTA